LFGTKFFARVVEPWPEPTDSNVLAQTYWLECSGLVSTCRNQLERLKSFNSFSKEVIVFGLGGTEIVIILALGLVLFGAKRLPELGKGLGSGIREFKKGVSDLRGDLEDSLRDEPVVVRVSETVLKP
jgi:sec-independent protein translocase protein TatA